MKKILLIIGALIMAISINSCSDDNDDNQNQNYIIGKWRLSQLIVEGLDPVLVESLDLELNECEKKMTIEIFGDGNYTEKDYEYNEFITECVLYDISDGTWEYLGNSMYSFSGLNSEPIKVTVDGNKIIAEYTETYEGISATLKLIFIADKDVVPDNIIGKWRQDQEFIDNIETPLSDCDKMGTLEFFEDGFYEERDFNDDSQTGCIEIPTKTGLWKNIGDPFYKMTNIDVDDAIKITFENNKMIIELTIGEEGVDYLVKLIFIKVTT